MKYLSLKYNKNIYLQILNNKEIKDYETIINKYETKKNKIIDLFNKKIILLKQQIQIINKQLLFENKQLIKNNNNFNTIKKNNNILKNKILDSEKNNNEFQSNKSIFLFINYECYNKSKTTYKINEYHKLFIKILYNQKAINTNYNLVNYSNIEKLLFNYKKHCLEQVQIVKNKNKPFNNQIKTINSEITKLQLIIKLNYNSIKDTRLSKIKYYKELNNDFYNNLLSNISFNLEKEILLITKSFFFDTNEVYELINKITLLELKVKELNYSKQIIINNKKYYNSPKFNLLLSSIKKTDKFNNTSLVSLYKIINNKMKETNNQKNSYPIIIQNSIKFNEFYYLLNVQVFTKQINKLIIENKKNINYLTNKKLLLQKQMNYFNEIVEFKKHSSLLFNNYHYYQNELFNFEKKYFKMF